MAPPQIKFKVHKYLSSAAQHELMQTHKSSDDATSILEDDQEELMSFILTEDVFVEILAARLQVKHIRFDTCLLTFSFSYSETRLSSWCRL